jgi:phosphomannomutase
VGVIYDGDGDRVMFIDEKGEFVPPDLIIALLGEYFLDKPKEKVLQDIRSSKSIKEYLSRYDAEVHTWRVGRAFAVPKLKEIDGIYGGELAGHYYFKDFYYSDSGILASLIVLDIVASAKNKGKTFSQIISEISNYENSGEINFKIEQKKEAMEELKEHFTNKESPIEVMDFDGYRLEFRDWWFNVRPSNTEPYLRLIVEAVDESTLNEKVDEIKSVITKYN